MTGEGYVPRLCALLCRVPGPHTIFRAPDLELISHFIGNVGRPDTGSRGVFVCGSQGFSAPRPGRSPVRRLSRGEVNTNDMRKNFALGLIALLALMLAFAVVGCGGKKAEEQATTPPPAPEQGGAMDTSMQMGGGGMGADTSMKK